MLDVGALSALANPLVTAIGIGVSALIVLCFGADLYLRGLDLAARMCLLCTVLMGAVEYMIVMQVSAWRSETVQYRQTGVSTPVAPQWQWLCALIATFMLLIALIVLIARGHRVAGFVVLCAACATSAGATELLYLRLFSSDFMVATAILETSAPLVLAVGLISFEARRSARLSPSRPISRRRKQ
jgi:hypothetical protein